MASSNEKTRRAWLKQITPEEMAQRRKDNIVLLVIVFILILSYFGYRHYKKHDLSANGIVTIAHVDLLGINSRSDSYRYTFRIKDTYYHGTSDNDKHSPVMKNDSLYIRYDPQNPDNNEPASDILYIKTIVK